MNKIDIRTWKAILGYNIKKAQACGYIADA
jgi:hypothetical protein